MTGRRADGAPIYSYVRTAGAAPVSVARLPGADWPVGEPAAGHAHAHDFLVLVYFERGAGTIRLDRRAWAAGDGDVFVIAPGEVVAAGGDGRLAGARAWCVFFDPEVLEPRSPAAFPSWRAHPLLFSFLGHGAGGAQRLRVPAADRAGWSQSIAALEAELWDRRDGAREAVLAHLTLLLVRVARLAADVGDELRLRDEPLLAAVFEAIDARYGEPISLADIAATVNLTPGHLTTVVRRKTGRTVQGWIAERRMAEARRLLSQTDLPVETIAARVGYRHSSYFIKQFRQGHSSTPAAWRRAGRPG